MSKLVHIYVFNLDNNSYHKKNELAYPWSEGKKKSSCPGDYNVEREEVFLLDERWVINKVSIQQLHLFLIHLVVYSAPKNKIPTSLSKMTYGERNIRLRGNWGDYYLLGHFHG